ncbi:transposase [Nocardia abscessus]|nr:transposase [Nocardia abscessus]
MRETGKSIAHVARELGINDGTLGNWVDKDRRSHDGGDGAIGKSERTERASGGDGFRFAAAKRSKQVGPRAQPRRTGHARQRLHHKPVPASPTSLPCPKLASTSTAASSPPPSASPNKPHGPAHPHRRPTTHRPHPQRTLNQPTLYLRKQRLRSPEMRLRRLSSARSSFCVVWWLSPDRDHRRVGVRRRFPQLLVLQCELIHRPDKGGDVDPKLGEFGILVRDRLFSAAMVARRRVSTSDDAPRSATRV